MSLNRGRFLAAAAAFGALPATAAAHGEALPPHVHGRNGTRLPLNSPINMTIRILDGPDLALQSYRGKVVVMNYFATWCPSCREETPDLEKFAAANLDDTMVFGVNYREEDNTVRAFRKRFGLTFPIAMDEKGIYFANIGLKYFPSTLIFRPDGTLSCVYPGSLSFEDLIEERRLALADADAAPVSSPAPDSPSPAPSSPP